MIREIKVSDLEQVILIWNEVVGSGNVFTEVEILNINSAKEFFFSQDYTGVIEINNEILGVYILHPNNIGRSSHIANASYVIKSNKRGMKLGEKLVNHSLLKAKELNFRIMQYNAVVASNIAALKLYNNLGFKQLGVIPGGYKNINNEFVDIIPHYIEL